MKNELNVDQIRKLWILDLIIQSGSLKGAAARAKISASAVSQSLSALEKSVGKSLVVRQRGTVEPTEEALSILEVVRPAFLAFDRLSTLGSQPVPQMTWLNFGAYESIAVDIVPGLIHGLRDKLPHLRLGLRIGRSEQLLTMVRKGELCSAIITEMDDLERFYKIPVCEDRLGVYVSARHPAGSPLQIIERLGFGSLAPGKTGLPRYYARFMKRLAPLKPSVVSESFETLRVAAASGCITAILPHRVASRASDLVEITPPAETKANGTHQVFVVSPTNCDREETDFLADEVRRLLQRGRGDGR